MLALVRSSGLCKPSSAHRNSAHIPGMICQPPRSVRVAYWWAAALQAQGWRLFEVGEQTAGGGFIAEIQLVGDESVWVICPRDMPEDGTEASALANHLQRLTFDQRDYFRRLLAAGPARQIAQRRLSDDSRCGG